MPVREQPTSLRSIQGKLERSQRPDVELLNEINMLLDTLEGLRNKVHDVADKDGLGGAFVRKFNDKLLNVEHCHMCFVNPNLHVWFKEFKAAVNTQQDTPDDTMDMLLAAARSIMQKMTR